MDIQDSNSLGNFLATVLTLREQSSTGPTNTWSLIGWTLASTGLGFGAAYGLYIARPALPEKLARSLSFFHRPLTRALWVDEIYDLLFVRPLMRFSNMVVFRRIEVGLIDGGIVDGAATAVRVFASHGMKYFQSGLTQGYLLVMVAGALAMLVYLAG